MHHDHFSHSIHPLCVSASLRLQKTSNRRAGVTLLELMLVLAVLVALAALAWPSLEKPFDNQRLRKSADLVRAQWTRARVKAMDSGLIHVFRLDSTTGRIWSEPWAGLDADLEVSDFSVPSTATIAAGGPQDGDSEKLPEGITLVSIESAADARAESAMSGAASAGTQLLNDSATEIFFYTDGTTSTARLVLINEHELYIALDLRGLTGVARVSDLLTAEELNP